MNNIFFTVRTSNIVQLADSINSSSCCLQTCSDLPTSSMSRDASTTRRPSGPSSDALFVRLSGSTPMVSSDIAASRRPSVNSSSSASSSFNDLRSCSSGPGGGSEYCGVVSPSSSSSSCSVTSSSLDSLLQSGGVSRRDMVDDTSCTELHTNARDMKVTLSRIVIDLNCCKLL